MSDLNNNQYVSAFFVVPSRIMNLPGLTLAFLKFYETIFQFLNHGHDCYLSNAALKERTGINAISTIQEAFQFFELHGELERITIEGRRYIVQPERKKAIKPPDKDEGGIAVPIGGYRCTDRGGIAVPIHNTKKVNIKKNNIYIPDFEKSGKTKKGDYKADERFMRFYNEYPKKEDPRDAWKAFKSVIGDNDVLLEQIIADIKLRKSKHSRWQDKQFIKYPAVYLRKGEYLGEIFNAEENLKEKRAREEEQANLRREEQEEISRKRAEQERLDALNKQTDAYAYRKILKELPSKAQIAGLQSLKSILGR